MNKEFAPYEPSLNLKELGFDEPCFAWYDGRYPSSINQNYCKNSEEWLNTIHCATPTFSQAFRWFREKHKLYHTINMFGDWDKPQYSYLVSGRTMNNPAHMWHFEDKDSHEEAELACLIKLIEIVNNK
jgi:pyruvate/2-oxoacid:ferredoxin oxidoreductase beta subunit